MKSGSSDGLFAGNISELEERRTFRRCKRKEGDRQVKKIMLMVKRLTMTCNLEA